MTSKLKEKFKKISFLSFKFYVMPKITYHKNVPDFLQLCQQIYLRNLRNILTNMIWHQNLGLNQLYQHCKHLNLVTMDKFPIEYQICQFLKKFSIENGKYILHNIIREKIDYMSTKINIGNLPK